MNSKSALVGERKLLQSEELKKANTRADRKPASPISLFESEQKRVSLSSLFGSGCVNLGDCARAAAVAKKRINTQLNSYKLHTDKQQTS